MSDTLRNVLAVVGGAVVAVVGVSIGDAIVGTVWSLPPGIDTTDREALARAIATLPTAAFVSVLAGWTIAAAAGSFVATRLSAARRPWAGLVVTAILLAATIANLVLLSHPLWMWPAAFIAIPVAGWFAARAASLTPRQEAVAAMV